ncbi:nuclear transport factor 2 family protein [Burkholderia stagnalis]|uniref:nuclear transport factor 2 family protein n=1 Tax=Burkholderia stagnalis TaxID=1503054 RepID=UPI000756B636|nr:nuclear transport factor 2 family protein [Burkholderia stagnalis]KWI26731.1 polyketide cyclase [Burkholderia stagnalis]KWI76017.1 polyketide cyclase [Burkholderia stagnalis]
MPDSQVFLDTLDTSLVAIERWLSGADTTGAALHALMAPFAPGFTMILTDGRAFDRDGTRELFAKLAGAKAGLRITLSDVRVLASDDRHAVITYLEAQHAATGELPARRATAVFARDTAGAVRWTHLQETFCTA